jgi:hypothetical protein
MLEEYKHACKLFMLSIFMIVTVLKSYINNLELRAYIIIIIIIIIIMAIRPFVPPWPPFQFLDPIYSL